MTQTFDPAVLDLKKGPVLVLDAAGRACQAAIYSNGQCRAHRNPEMTYGQAEWLIPVVQEVAAEAECLLSDLTAVITTVGPGSFTGLRVGIAAAKGFGIAANCPVVGVTSLSAWAFSKIVELGQPVGLDPATGLRVILDSRRGDAFVQDFDLTGQILNEPRILPVDQASAENEMHLIGDLVSDQPAPALAGIYAAAISTEHQMPAHPVYLRDADAVPMAKQ